MVRGLPRAPPPVSLTFYDLLPLVELSLPPSSVSGKFYHHFAQNGNLRVCGAKVFRCPETTGVRSPAILAAEAVLQWIADQNKVHFSPEAADPIVGWREIKKDNA